MRNLLFHNAQAKPTDSSLSKPQEGCWICQNLDHPEHLVYFQSGTSIAKLNPDQLFQGYTFLALKRHQEQLHKLPDKERESFLHDMSLIGRALARALDPDRVNYELLGNAQPHLHWHIIPRYVTDPLWGRPIWAGSKRRKHLAREEYASLVKKIKQYLPTTINTAKPQKTE